MSLLKTTLVCCYTGSTVGVNIQQMPPISLTPIQTKSVVLECQHDDSTHYRMFWYIQKTSGELSLVAFSAGENDGKIEPPFDSSKYTITRTNMLESSLQIKDLEYTDSSTYFCATSVAQ